jgi:hypothetical protein
LSHTTPRLREELLAEGVLTNGTDAVFESLGGTEHDGIWTRAACLVIERRKPHLLLLHLLNTVTLTGCALVRGVAGDITISRTDPFQGLKSFPGNKES